MDNNDNDRIQTAKNRVFYSDGLGLGRNNPISLHTNSQSVYRMTGFGQIADIINCGYVRPKKGGRVKGGHVNEVFWSIGGEKTFYYSKAPILEAPADKVKDNQIGSITLDDLSAIWIFDDVSNSYVDKKAEVCQIKSYITKTGSSITKDELKQIFNNMKIQNNNKNILEEFFRLRELDRNKFIQLREQQLMGLNQSIIDDENNVKKAR